MSDRPLVMGVVNVTPDSFSDGGTFLDAEAAVAHGLQLIRDGADIVDVGGEATNPRARPIGAAEELCRVLPVVERLAAAGARVSIDTTKAEVARQAVAAGASIVNDVSGGLFDPEMLPALASLDVTFVLGHLRGRSLADVFAAEGAVGWREVADELGERLSSLPEPARARAWVDPGIGFGKGSDPEANLELLRRTGDLGRALGCPVVVGPSRKRFLRRLIDEARRVPGAGEWVAAGRAEREPRREPIERSDATGGVSGAPDMSALDTASAVACLGAIRAGAHVVRVHNVALLRAALAVYTKL